MSKKILPVMRLLLMPCLVAWFFVSGSPVFAQSELGEGLEKDGRLEEALKAYTRALSSDSMNFKALAGAKRIYKTLGQHGNRIPFIQRELSVRPGDEKLLCELFDVYLRLNDEAQAQAVLDRLLGSSQVSIGTYLSAASVLIENARLQQALGVYERGRKYLNDKSAFSMEMVRLLSYLGKCDAATTELLLQFDLGRATADQTRAMILRLPDGRKENTQIAAALQTYLKNGSTNYILRRTLYEVQMRDRQYDAAFETTLELDNQFKKQGAEVLAFATEAFEQGVWEHAIKAYRYFLRLYPNTPQADMGIARCMDEMTPSSRSGGGQVIESQKVPETQTTDPAIDAYKSIATKYPTTQWSAEACYRIGYLLMNRLNDVDAALTWLDRVEREFVQSAYRFEAQFLMAECYVRQNKLDQAQPIYEGIRQQLRSGPLAERATYQLAELMFLMQRLDQAASMLKSVSSRTDGVYTNDALGLLLLLQENYKSKELLSTYCKAALLGRQGRPNEGVAVLSALIRENPKAPIADDAIMLVGDFLVEMGRPKDAIERWKNIVDYMSEGPLPDLALKKIGETYEKKLSDTQMALQAYRELLRRFPHSIYATPVRKKLRELEQKLSPSS